MIQKTCLPVLIIISMAFLASCASTPQKKTISYNVQAIEAEGMAPMGTDLGVARKNAISDAQKRAIESVVGVYISADSLVSKAQLVEDNITSQTEGFIDNYKILSEKKDNDFYKVTIKAWVRNEDLNKKISEMDLSPKKYGNPVVSFWIEDKIDAAPSGSSIVELELIKQFVNAGYVVSGLKPKDVYNSPSSLILDSSDNLMKLNSDIVVIGDASAAFNTDEGLGGLVSYRANLSLKTLMTSTRDIITTDSVSASGVDVNKQSSSARALENVAKKAGTDLPRKVLSYLKERAYPVVIVKNLQDLLQAKRLIYSFKTFPTVKDCWIRTYSDKTAVFTLDLKRGNLDEVGKMLELNDNFKFKVQNAGKYSMDVVIESEKQ